MKKESTNHFQAVRKSRVSREIVAQIRDMFPDVRCPDTLGIEVPVFMDCGERSVTKCWKGGETPGADCIGTERNDFSEPRDSTC
jgi:hypothetical protein